MNASLARTHSRERSAAAASGAGGFTAIELLTVFVLIAVVVTMAAPSLQDFVDRNRTRRALDRIAGDVAYARVLAAQEGRSTAIHFLESGYTVDTLTSGGGWAAIRTVSLGQDFRGVSLAAEGAISSLEFSSRGLITNLSGEGFVTVSRNTVRDSVYVSPAGRVYRAF